MHEEIWRADGIRAEASEVGLLLEMRGVYDAVMLDPQDALRLARSIISAFDPEVAKWIQERALCELAKLDRDLL